MKSPAEHAVYRAANMAAAKSVESLVRQPDAENKATTWCIADTDIILNHPQREIDCITLNEQMQFQKELLNRLMKFEIWWRAIGFQEVRKSIEQGVIHFGYPKMQVVSHILESIR